MAGMDHDFLLLEAMWYSPRDYMRFINHPDAINLHDDLMFYLNDPFLWIPTLNPSTGKASSGFNPFGPTAIQKEGAALAARVFKGWADVLALGPSQLDLTGPYCWENGMQGPGQYERLLIDRDETVATLNTLADYCQQVDESGGKLFVLHLGI